jgi:rhamnulokinase
MPTTVIAIDLGAESGRVISGTFDGRAVTLQEHHRFATTHYERAGHWFWDVRAITASIEEGLRQAFAVHPEVASIGIDTWGVDYVLVDAAGAALRDPYCYRDLRTQGLPEAAEAKVGSLYRRSAVRPLVFNTVFQMMAEARDHAADLERAEALLLMPDYLHARLGGAKVAEWTIASTTGLVRPGAQEWDTELMERLGIPSRLFRTLTPSGRPTGALLPELCRRLGYRGVQAPRIIPPGSHDTASAVAAMPADPATACFISSGTWSLMGVVADQPLVGEAAEAALISNEVAWDGRFRPLKNIIGLWLVQNCRKAFAEAGREYDYAALTQLAEASPAPAAPFDADDPRFLPICTPQDTMPARIQSWYRERGLPVPEGDGAITRAALESLADAYRKTLESFTQLTGRRFRQISLLGGGSKNGLLCQLTAKATGLEVLAGPEEATALGNILVQLRGLGVLAEDAAMREVVKASCAFRVWNP